MPEPVARKQRRLTEPRVTEVSAVDEPAHLHRGWIIKKGVGQADAARLLAALGVGGTVPEIVYPMAKAVATLKDLTPFQRGQITDGASFLKALTEPQTETLRKDAGVEDLQPVADQIAQVWQTVQDLINREDPTVPSISVDPNAPDATGAVAVPGAVPGVPAAPDAAAILASPALAKALAPGQVEILKAVAEQAAAAQETLRKEREERADAEAVAEFEKSYAGMDIDASVTAPALRRFAAIDEAGAAAVREALTKAASLNQSAETIITKEIGRVITPSGDSPEGQVETIAKALHAAGQAKTIEQARALAWQQNPALYAQARSEKKGA